MQTTMYEMKDTLDGNNSRLCLTGKKKKDNFLNKNTTRMSQDNFKYPNVHVIGVSIGMETGDRRNI